MTESQSLSPIMATAGVQTAEPVEPGGPFRLGSTTNSLSLDKPVGGQHSVIQWITVIKSLKQISGYRVRWELVLVPLILFHGALQVH